MFYLTAEGRFSMEKSRTLPVDYGIEAGRQMYWGSSGGIWDYLPEEPRSEQWLKDRISIGQSSANVPYTLYGAVANQGFQHFESSEERRPKYNSCTNEKFEGFEYPYHLVCESVTNPAWLLYNPYSVLSLPADPNRISTIRATDKAVVLGNLWSAAEGARRRAWWNMQPKFEGRVNLLNFLFELKDFRDILKSAGRFNYRSLGEDLKSLKRLLGRAEKGLGITDPTVGDIPRLVRLLDSSTRGLAAGYLTNEFAIKPTVRDVLQLHQMASQTAVRAEREFEARGKIQNRAHFAEKLKDGKPYVKYAATGQYYWRECVSSVEWKFNASMEYFYSYRRRPAMAALRRYWGLDLNAEVVWNALPFSFICDYFIGVADSLHAMGADPNVALALVQYCESILYERDFAWYLLRDPRVCWSGCNGEITANGPDRMPVTGYRYSLYQRRTVEPNRGPALPKITVPSLGQSCNLMALIRCWI